MNVRVTGIAIALVLAMGCKTSGSQTGAEGSTKTSSGDTYGGQPGAQAPSDQQGSQSGATAGTAAPGRASDQVVTGAINQVSPRAVAIVDNAGKMMVLEIVPQTSITIEGMEASSSDLEEGQLVRASFNKVNGQDVAVRIQVMPGSYGG